MAKKINKKDIGNLLSQWIKEFSIFVPSRSEGIAKMQKWDGKDTTFLDWYRNTVVPPKASFFPNFEKMFSFRKNGDGYKLEMPPEPEKQMVFGIRPCDARALAALDITFQDAYQDPYYISRRKNGVVVGLGCTNPYDSCFCTSMGVNPAESADVDLMLIDIGEQFIIEEVSQKGKSLIASVTGMEEATASDIEKAKEAKEKAKSKVTRKLNTKGIGEKLLGAFDNQDFWKEVAAKCVSCGICTLLCPTCFCFDINDDLVNKEGARFRNWDSCGFSLYTRMPMENPRSEKWRRVRQKVCHKFEFYPFNFDIIACTGCGRCIRLCPVNWDITQVLESVPEAKQTVTTK